MTDKVEKLQKRVDELVAALIQLAHELKEVPGAGLEATHIQSAGSTLHQCLVALNDGRGPTGKLGA